MDFSKFFLFLNCIVKRVCILAFLKTGFKCFFKSLNNFSSYQMRFIISNQIMAASSLFCYLFDKVLITSISKSKSIELHIICASWLFNNLLLIVDHSISQHENSFLFFWPHHFYCVIYRTKNISSSKITIKLFKLFNSGLDSLLVIFDDFLAIDYHWLVSWSKTDDREWGTMWNTT